MDIGRALHTSEQVRAIERAAIAGAGIAGIELMRRAAQAAFDFARQRWPAAARLGVLCGPGNNGGDGYLFATLARRAGLQVDVIALAANAPSSEEARDARQQWRVAGGSVRDSTTLALNGYDLLVDALFGIGLARAPAGDAQRCIAAANACGVPVLALDLPSGLDADTGHAAGEVVRASATITFIADKQGLHTAAARGVCGDIVVASLGLDALVAGFAPSARLLQADDLLHWLPPRGRASHKGRHGHVLAIGGDSGYAGAIRLCAEAALRSGAGLVSVATRAAHVAALVAARPEAMAHGVEHAAGLSPLLARASVIAIGPGLGRQSWGRALFDAVMHAPQPRVFDADALGMLSDARLPLGNAILTPHPGEAARLLDCDVGEVEADRYTAARAIAERFGAVVVLKGAGSIVAAPGHDPSVIGAGNPGLAAGGSGDVLTGTIAAMRAQGLAAHDAACAGALLHAVAADAAASDGGERGMLASDLFPWLRHCANPCP